MLKFNITRRFRVTKGTATQTLKQVLTPKFNLAQSSGSPKNNIDKMHAIDDSVLSYLAEAIVRELAEKGTLTSQFRQQLHCRVAEIPADTDLPLVSVGPSGICGRYQNEIR